MSTAEQTERATITVVVEDGVTHVLALINTAELRTPAGGVSPETARAYLRVLRPALAGELA